MLVHFARMGAALSELTYLTHDDGNATPIALRKLTDLSDQLTGRPIRDA